ncbi:hypothetical protein Tco_1256228 [Tanacetum coccineum]
MQHISTKTSATTDTKAKRSPKTVTPPSESVSEEDSDLEQVRRIRTFKELASFASISMLYNPTKQQLLVNLKEKVRAFADLLKFHKPSVVRQPNAQRVPKPLVLGKPTPFSNSPEMKSFQMKQSVNKTNVSDGLFKQVTQQNLPQNIKQAKIHSNVLKPRMYRIATTTTQNREPQLPHASRNTNPHVSKSSRVIHTTSVSRLRLKCYQVKDKVVPNNSQVKFKNKEVEDHHRISSISKKTKSVTACNDSSNSRTLNMNAFCAECGKCVFNSNHDACVSRYFNDVNTRTNKPNVVPISASKPKRKANKSVATPHKKIVASDTTIQKSKSYYKELYENTNKEWKWKDDVSTSISPTIDIIVQLILFIVDSGCTKHMTGNLKLLCNFVEKFLGTVSFGNDQILLQFLVGQFCDADLELLLGLYLFLRDPFRRNEFTHCRIRDNVIYNKRTRLIVESILAKFDEIKEMMSDHNSSDLAPQRQEMSVENVSSGLIPQGQKASDYDNSDPVPPRQNVCSTSKKTDSSQQWLEFLFSPLLKNITIGKEEFEGESSSRNIDNTDVHSYQPQSHDFQWTRDHPLEQVRGNLTMPVQTRRQLAQKIQNAVCSALTVNILEPKNIKEAMADSAWIEAMQDELVSLNLLSRTRKFGHSTMELRSLIS